MMGRIHIVLNDVIPVRWRDGDANIVQVRYGLKSGSAQATIAGTVWKSSRGLRCHGDVHIHIVSRRSAETVVGFVCTAVSVEIARIVVGSIVEPRRAYIMSRLVSTPNIEPLALIIVS